MPRPTEIEDARNRQPAAQEQPFAESNTTIRLMAQYGISQDHAARITFTLSDNERAKTNIGADFGYFGAYVRDLQSRAGGAAPKL